MRSPVCTLRYLHSCPHDSSPIFASECAPYCGGSRRCRSWKQPLNRAWAANAVGASGGRIKLSPLLTKGATTGRHLPIYYYTALIMHCRRAQGVQQRCTRGKKKCHNHPRIMVPRVALRCLRLPTSLLPFWPKLLLRCALIVDNNNAHCK